MRVVNNNDSTTTAMFIKSSALFMLYKADSALGNCSQVMRFLKQHMDLKEFIFEQNQSRQIEELSIRYETAKKDQNLRFKNPGSPSLVLSLKSRPRK